MTKFIVAFSTMVAMTVTASLHSAEEYSRYQLTHSERTEVFEKNRHPLTGKVHDPLTGKEIMPTDKWDAAHKPGQEFWRAKQEAVELGKPRDQFRAEQKNLDLYRPESPSTNRSHVLEAPRVPSKPPVPSKMPSSGSWIKSVNRGLKWLSKIL